MDLTDIWTLLIVGCTALVLAAVFAVVYLYLARQKEARSRQLVAVSEVTRDWRTTWKINAVTDARVMENEKDDIPSNFVLRIEENRMVRLHVKGRCGSSRAPQWLLVPRPAQELLVPPSLDRNRPVQARLLSTLRTRRQGSPSRRHRPV